MRKKRPAPRTHEWSPISIERDGKVYKGEYRVGQVMITVHMMGGGTTTTHVSASGKNESLACPRCQDNRYVRIETVVSGRRITHALYCGRCVHEWEVENIAPPAQERRKDERRHRSERTLRKATLLRAKPDRRGMTNYARRSIRFLNFTARLVVRISGRAKPSRIR